MAIAKRSMYEGLRDRLPSRVRDHVMHFEAMVEDAVARFSASLAPGARLLDAGAGEGKYKHYFAAQRYCGIDLGVAAGWDYSHLDVTGDLLDLPFRDHMFDGCLNVLTLEHVREPARVLGELARTLVPGGRLLLIVPHEWEEHLQPHDYYRYTRYGLEYLLQQAGMSDISVAPVGGYFRLLARRMLNGLQFFPGPLIFVAALFLVPPALVLPLLEPLDQQKSFTLGYICSARKPLGDPAQLDYPGFDRRAEMS